MAAEYPKRPSFFALRFTRLLGKACVANEYGAQAVLLLITIAHQEDAKGYRGPVTYWNGQLMPIIGIESIDTLERIRRKLINAGWLHYRAGSKSKPAQYWVNVPMQYETWDDAPTCETSSEMGSHSAPESDLEQPKNVVSQTQQNQGDNANYRTGAGESPENLRVERGLNADQTRVERGLSAEPSSCTSTYPKEIKSCPALPDVVTNDTESPATKPRREPTGDHHAAIRCFCEAWKVTYRADYAFAGGRDASLVAGILKRPGVTLDVFRAAVGRYFADTSAFVLDARHGLGLLSSQFHKYLTDVKPSAGGVYDRGTSRTYRVAAKPGKYDDLDHRRPGDAAPPVPGRAGADGAAGGAPGHGPPRPGGSF